MSTSLKIKNKELTVSEKTWLEWMLVESFLYKEETIKQIESATISRVYTKYYISIKFKIDRNVLPINIKIRVPVEMHLYWATIVPMQFLLHYIDGYIDELEIFNGDSSAISENFNYFNYDKMEVIVSVNQC